MASIEAKYESNWISRDKAIQICEAYGFGLGPAGRLLERLKQDRWPPLSPDRADPARDLFRISPRASFGDGLVGHSDRHGALRRLYEFGRGWESIEISRAVLMTLLPKPRLARKGKGGRKSKFDWDDAKDFARNLWKERGPFRSFDEGWRSKADMEREVAVYMVKHDPAGEPSESQLKEYVRKWISEFKGRKLISG